jgi:rhamnosyltransferase subunit B
MTQAPPKTIPADQQTPPGSVPPRRGRIVLTTFGSLGDLHPYIALALGLQSRGHEAIIGTSDIYRQKIEALGIGFRAIRPDISDWETDPELVRRLLHRTKGSETVVRELVMPAVRDSYEDVLASSTGADLLVSHVLTFGTRLAAEKTGIPWASSVLAPISFLSAYDPPVLPPAPFLTKLRFLGPVFFGPMFRFLKWTLRSWGEPWHRLRADIGLPPTKENPLFEGQHSPCLVLALFSRHFAAKQRDWPPQTVLTGFPFYDQHGGSGLPPALARFLEEGPPPIVFTLGSSAVHDAGTFYEHSVAAAKLLGRRAVLLVGSDAEKHSASLPTEMAAFNYAPFSELFPRAAAVVHQGGVGTTAQALRAGCPMMVMPYAHDQPDNGERVTRLGVARTMDRTRYNPASVAAELRQLLQNPAYARRAAEIGKEVQQENGVGSACDALEDVLAGRKASRQKV